MSDRFYTTLHVSGPNAATAEKAAIEALKTINHEKYRACWIDADTIKEWDLTPEQREEMEADGPQFFDHDSGQIAIETVARVSHKFPSETFCLLVDGGYGEGRQGHVEIHKGRVLDERSEELAYGEEPEDVSYRVYYVDADGKDVTKDAEAEIEDAEAQPEVKQ